MQANIREGPAAPLTRNIQEKEAGKDVDEEKIVQQQTSHQKELTTSLYHAASEGLHLPNKSSSQKKLSSSSSTNGGRLVISETRASSVSNLKVKPEPTIRKEATTSISKENTSQDLAEQKSKASEGESKTSSSKSSQSVISHATIHDETKRPDSVWSSLFSNFGSSPDKKTPSALPACPEIPPGLQGRISLNMGILPLSQV